MSSDKGNEFYYFRVLFCAALFLGGLVALVTLDKALGVDALAAGLDWPLAASVVFLGLFVALAWWAMKPKV
ncbi:hypothetical protein Pfra02_44650 [Pseudomonas fragi]|nr:hypothetical protein Pfra02_44650 [Pseudomonas fragi]